MKNTKSILKGIGLVSLVIAAVYGISKLTTSKCCECDCAEEQDDCEEGQSECGVNSNEEDN